MMLCGSCGACFDDDYDLCAYDGAPLAAMFPGPRTLAQRYLLEQRVAAGAMGIVFRATHLLIGSVVAVKLMLPQHDQLKVGLARFRREAQILGQIKHPNAVLVMDFGVEQRDRVAVPYLVTEYLRGRSLAQLLEERATLDLDETERILSAVCDAVEEAHQVGVIHRDLKPSNIFLEQLRDGSHVPKVLDFGIAKFVELKPETLRQLQHEDPSLSFVPQESHEMDLLEEVTRVQLGEPTCRDRVPPAALPAPDSEDGWTVTKAGFMVGTIPYMAPEQLTGESVSRQTDVYALGLLCYRLLVGRLPFQGDDEDVILAKLEGDVPSARLAGAAITEALDALLRQAMSMDPAARPPSARAFAAALRQAREGDQAPGLRRRASLADELRDACRCVEETLAATRAFSFSSDAKAAYLRVRDSVIALEDPLRRAQRAVDANDAAGDGADRPLLVELARSLDKYVESVSRALHGVRLVQGDEYFEYLSAIWSRVERQCAELSAALSLKLGLQGDDTPVITAVDDPFALIPADADQAVLEQINALAAEDPLDRADALGGLLEQHLEMVLPLIARGAHDSTPVLETMVQGLWQQADTLLLMELFPGPHRTRVLPLLTRASAVSAAATFADLGSLFAGERHQEGTARQSLEAHVAGVPSAADQAIYWRCLLVHPNASVCELAAERTPPAELWNVIVYPRTPVRTLRIVFERVEPHASAEYLKIFFLCVRDRLAAAVKPDDMRETFLLLQRFFRVPCFHEDLIFDPLLELEQTLRRRRLAAGASAAEQDTYEAVLAEFCAGGSQPARPLEHMREIPLPIQRKLAREGHLLRYFATHAVERIARETIPHLLRLEDVTSYLRLPTLHRAVLADLARERRFFKSLGPRLALLQHPKTTAQIARQHLPLVPREQVRALMNNHHVSHEVRELARKLWQRVREA